MTKFIRSSNSKPIENFEKELLDGGWRKFNVEAHLSNELLPSKDLHKEIEVIPGVIHISSGLSWDENLHQLTQDYYYPNVVDKCSFSDFVELSEDYFKKLNAERIGVHLSGGLDSSIVICLLKKLGIPYTAIGLKSDTYEFRTERRIQELLSHLNEDSQLIEISSYPFYSKLDEIPFHLWPLASIKSYWQNEILVNAFAKRGCDVVISGQGGDSLLVGQGSASPDLKFNLGNEFLLNELQEYNYGPKGIRLESFYAYKPIIDLISSARIGMTEDPLKIWMRNWAKDILPAELVEHTYYGDYFAMSMSDLDQAKPTIKHVFESAYALCGNELFSSSNTKKFINQDIFNFEYNDYIRFCSLLSVAVWYNSLKHKLQYG